MRAHLCPREHQPRTRRLSPRQTSEVEFLLCWGAITDSPHIHSKTDLIDPCINHSITNTHWITRAEHQHQPTWLQAYRTIFSIWASLLYLLTPDFTHFVELSSSLGCPPNEEEGPRIREEALWISALFEKLRASSLTLLTLDFHIYKKGLIKTSFIGCSKSP